MRKSIDAEKYWNQFLQSGKVDDFLKYRKALQFNETITDIEIGKINESNEVSHAEKNSVYRNSIKKS